MSGRYISGRDEQGAPTGFDDRDRLGALSVPALVVVGRHDFICGPRWSRELAGSVPGADLLVLEQSGHFGHLEQPDRFAAAVADFVRASSE